MSELKTIGLLTQVYDPNEGMLLKIEELKAEAVKWVKHIKPEGDRPLWSWIVRFFNLTEEDLKEESE